MKANHEHRVPLSCRAAEILQAARTLRDSSGLVFPNPSGNPLSDMTLSKLLKEQGVQAVPHGFRSSFRDWAAEEDEPSAGGRRGGPRPSGQGQGRSRVCAVDALRAAAPADG